MKKPILKSFLLIVAFAMVLFSCKDEFTEQDALDAQQTIDMVITVVDASDSYAPVDGATVKVLVDSTFVSRTTNSSGSVVFPKIKISEEMPVFVSKDGYTSVMSEVYMNTYSYRETQCSEVVTVYSLASEKLATFKGKLTMQSDLTDRDREPAVGVIVKATNANLNGIEETFIATTDNQGNYSLSVPVSSSGDYISLTYPDFTENQKLAFVQPNGSKEVIERTVLYKPSTSGSLRVPCVPSIYATVAAPAASAGTGFALGTIANRVSLSPNSSVTLIDGGAGYNGGVSIADYQMPFSADPSGNIATLQVDITNGKITNIDNIVNNGATYSTAPTLNVNSLTPTTPATIVFNFQTTYKIFITNKGTNYFVYPQVSVEAEDFSGGVKYKVIDNNVDDNSNVILGTSWLFTNYANIYNGMIRSDFNGDTLLAASAYLASTPVFTVNALTTNSALIDVVTSDISSSDSTLIDISVYDWGSGFNPTAPPLITLTTLAGYGSGAVVKTTVDPGNGSISSYFIISGGKGYVRNVNDFRKSGSTSNSDYDNPSYPTTYYNPVRQGDIFVQDVYYGTGYQVINQETGKK